MVLITDPAAGFSAAAVVSAGPGIILGAERGALDYDQVLAAVRVGSGIRFLMATGVFVPGHLVSIDAVTGSAIDSGISASDVANATSLTGSFLLDDTAGLIITDSGAVITV